MTKNKITTSNMTFRPQPNGDLLIRRRHLRNLVGMVLSLPFIAVGAFVLFRFIITLFSGRFVLEELGETLTWLLCSSGFGLFGIALWMYSLKQLRSPDILIEKTLRRVTLRPRLPFGAPAPSYPFDAFASVVHFVVPNRFESHRVGLMFADGNVMPIAEITKRQRDQTMEMLTTATGLPERELPDD